ncbi:MAG: small basic protein [Planctomycetota bacterium]
MTAHNSLRTKGLGSKHRNVLKRDERIDSLRKEGAFSENSSPFGLRKVRSIKVKKK